MSFGLLPLDWDQPWFRSLSIVTGPGNWACLSCGATIYRPNLELHLMAHGMVNARSREMVLAKIPG